MESKCTTIELGPCDSAFVLREDGSHDMYLENRGEDSEVSESMYIVAGLSLAFVRNRGALKEFVDQVYQELDDAK